MKASFKGFLCLGLASLTPISAFAWGHLGHQTLATVGAQAVSSAGGTFWSVNATSFGRLTNVPDQYWKTGASATHEKPTHWFQPDSYFTDPSQFSTFPRVYSVAVRRYGAAKIEANGTAPWRAQQFYDLALAAFKRGDFATGLQMAGVMSHYIGDMSQPLHVTENFDGQQSGDPAIHKFFETDNLEHAGAAAVAAEVQRQTASLLANPRFVALFRTGSVADYVFDEAFRAYALKDEVIHDDLSLGRGSSGADAQLKLAEARMADGAATLAMVLLRLSKEAGLKTLVRPAESVGIPIWVAPNFAPSPSPAVSADVVGALALRSRAQI